MGLKRKILVSFLAVVLLGVLQSLIGLFALTQLREQTNRIVEHNAPFALAVQQVKTLVLELERSQYSRLVQGPDANQLRVDTARANQEVAHDLEPLQKSEQGEAAGALREAVKKYGDKACDLAEALKDRATKATVLADEADQLANAILAPELKTAFGEVRIAELAYRANIDPLLTSPVADARMRYKRQFDVAVSEMNSAIVNAAAGDNVRNRADKYIAQFGALLDKDAEIAKLGDETRVDLKLVQEHLGRTAGGSLNTDLKDLYDQVRQRVMWITVTAVLGVVLAGIVAFVLANEIVKPVARLRQAVDRISLGEIDVRLDEPGTDDEIAGLTRAFQRMVASIRTLIQQEPP